MSEKTDDKQFWIDTPAFLRKESVGHISDLETWVKAKAADQSSTIYILAHFLDGINWGYLDKGSLTVSQNVSPNDAPQFRAETLIELRIFGEKAEYHLWRDCDGEFVGRWLIDGPAEDENDKQYTDSYDEKQMLWGTMAHKIANSNWKKMTDGEQGLVHVIPPFNGIDSLPEKNGEDRPLRLKIRHYVKHDKLNPDARVVVSRLVSLSSESK